MKVGDDKPNYKDLVKATDLSPVEISVDDGAVKYDQPGVYRIIFTATDKYKNKATKDATVMQMIGEMQAQGLSICIY